MKSRTLFVRCCAILIGVAVSGAFVQAQTPTVTTRVVSGPVVSSPVTSSPGRVVSGPVVTSSRVVSGPVVSSPVVQGNRVVVQGSQPRVVYTQPQVVNAQPRVVYSTPATTSKPVVANSTVVSSTPVVVKSTPVVKSTTTAQPGTPTVVSRVVVPATTASVTTPSASPTQTTVVRSAVPVSSTQTNVVVSNQAAYAPGNDMLSINNSYRARMGLGGHALHGALQAAAQAHAEYMARTGQFSHNAGGSPSSRAQRFGYNGLVRENIAYGQSGTSGAFQDWSRSSGHWQNMTSGTRSAGFGAARGSNGQMYYVALYGD